MQQYKKNPTNQKSLEENRPSQWFAVKDHTRHQHEIMKEACINEN